MRDLLSLPKAHLHVHLEGAVRGPVTAIEGFLDFFDRNQLVREALRAADDFRRVAAQMCEDQAADGVRYVEVSFTAAAHGERLGDLAMPLEAVLSGLAAGAASTGIAWRVILDTSRRRPVERAWRTLSLAKAYASAGVVAVGLAGDEAYPAAPFAEVFAAARDAGLHVVHHAGEAAGPASIRAALAVGAERIGHGITILSDPALVAAVREAGIALEVCPSSNVALGLVPSLAEHPLPRLVDAGLAATLNTDIPAMIGTTLTAEYAHARTVWGFDDDALAALALAAVDASWAPPAVVAALRTEIATWLAPITGRGATRGGRG